MEEEGELSEQKKEDLRRIADITWEAIVAASAKLLKIVFWVLKERRPYHG
jgi:hypothetical protein